MWILLKCLKNILKIEFTFYNCFIFIEMTVYILPYVTVNLALLDRWVNCVEAVM